MIEKVYRISWNSSVCFSGADDMSARFQRDDSDKTKTATQTTTITTTTTTTTTTTI